MTLSHTRTPPLLDSRVLRMEPMTQWWYVEDAVCVALRSVSRTPVVTVGGTLDDRAWTPCRRALGAALRARPRCVLVDLAAVTAGDDPGAALLEGMRRTASWHGAQLWLAAVPGPVSARLDRWGLIARFPISRNATRAIEEIRRAHLEPAARRRAPVAPRPDSRTA